ncbi:MAG: TolC family protein [Gammaproteobacteria bacterium]|nr:TolC family protein [Gammaproteobacteria bacterium]
MRRFLPMIFLVCAGAVADAHAEAFVDHADLPPLKTVQEVMANNSRVQVAEAGIRLEQANARKLNAGPYEASARLTQKRRAVDNGSNFNEWEAALERGLRLPGKAEIDRQLGAQGISQSRLAYGDALHEAGRSLLRLWFAWREQEAQVKQWQRQVEAFAEQSRIVKRRVEAGDAPRMEASLSEAAQAQAEYALRQARLRAQSAATELAQRFAGLNLSDDVPWVTPEPLEQGLDYWREKILEHNHELAFVRGETQRARLHVSRAGADKTPDPSVGVSYGSERSGEERIAGVFLSIPLPGEARAASESGAIAQSEVAARNEAATTNRINAEIITAYNAAVAGYDSWNSAQSAADGMQHNAELIARAYALGEMNLSEVLTARRQALEASLAASLAMLGARESRYRLLLDAHQLWPLDADEEEGGGAEHAHY